MGLSVVVGILSEVAEADPDAVEHYRSEFARLNEVLAEQGLLRHLEPEELDLLSNRCALDGFPYGFLHALRRVYAHRVRDPEWVVESMPDGEDPTEDPV